MGNMDKEKRNQLLSWREPIKTACLSQSFRKRKTDELYNALLIPTTTSTRRSISLRLKMCYSAL